MAKSIFLYIQKKDNISITADLDKLEAYTVDGSKGSASIKKLEIDAQKHFVRMDSIVSKINRVPENQRDSLIQIFNKTKDTYITFLKNFIEKEYHAFVKGIMPKSYVSKFKNGILNNYNLKFIIYFVKPYKMNRLHSGRGQSTRLPRERF